VSAHASHACDAPPTQATSWMDDDSGSACAACADPFAKKDWYDIKAPTYFQVRNIGKTLVSRTAGTKVKGGGRGPGLGEGKRGPAASEPHGRAPPHRGAPAAAAACAAGRGAVTESLHAAKRAP
jgi:hypothetical protein